MPNQNKTEARSPSRSATRNIVSIIFQCLLNIISFLLCLKCIEKLQKSRKNHEPEPEEQGEQSEQSEENTAGRRGVFVDVTEIPLSSLPATESETPKEKIPVPEGCLILNEQQLEEIWYIAKYITYNMHCRILYKIDGKNSEIVRHDAVLMICMEILSNVRSTSAYAGFPYIVPDIIPIIIKYREFIPSPIVRWCEDRADNDHAHLAESALSNVSYKQRQNVHLIDVPQLESAAKEDMKKELEQIKQKFNTQVDNMDACPFDYSRHKAQEPNLTLTWGNLNIKEILYSPNTTQYREEAGKTTHLQFSCHDGSSFTAPTNDIKKLAQCVKRLHWSLFLKCMACDDKKLAHAVIEKENQSIIILGNIIIPPELYEELFAGLGIDNRLLPIITGMLRPFSAKKDLVTLQPASPDQESRGCTQDIEKATRILEKYCEHSMSPCMEISEKQLQNLISLYEDVCKHQHHNLDLTQVCTNENHEVMWRIGCLEKTIEYCPFGTVLLILNTILRNAHRDDITHVIKIPNILTALVEHYQSYDDNPEMPADMVAALMRFFLLKQVPIELTVEPRRIEPSSPRNPSPQLREALELSEKELLGALTENDKHLDLSESLSPLPLKEIAGDKKIEMLHALRKELGSINEPHVRFTWDALSLVEQRQREKDPALKHSSKKEGKWKYYKPVVIPTAQFRDTIDQILQSLEKSEASMSYPKLYELCGGNLTLLHVINRIIYIHSKDVEPVLTPLTTCQEEEGARKKDIPGTSVTTTQTTATDQTPLVAV